ncbi:MAG: hypothetical protein JNL11_09255 [Bdellovibrionaceae bacterium]|nr:hypothetical protein [Pseudobdellovibrionaceae bacterium]
MKSKSKSFDYEINMEHGPILKPTQVEFFKHEDPDHKPHKPFKYHSDVLVALSFVNIHKTMKSDCLYSLDTAMDFWRAMEPHYELYGRSRKRVVAITEQTDAVSSQLTDKIEHKWNAILADVFSKNKVNMQELQQLIPLIDYLEDHMQKALLYNFSLGFTPEFQQRLLLLFSFLSNVRGLVALDHNSFVEDASHEAIKMDSITDYLAKPEYVVNDALLYFHFKKLFTPFVSGRSSDVKIDKLLYRPLDSHFQKFSHNACQLIDNVPSEFLTQLNPIELEQALYLVQMDWLLGSEAGLIFKIREELFGLQEGYEKVFWPEYDFRGHKHSTRLHVCCHAHFESGKKVA